MVQQSKFLHSNVVVRGSGKFDDFDQTRNVFTVLYNDAMRKQKEKQQKQQAVESMRLNQNNVPFTVMTQHDRRSTVTEGDILRTPSKTPNRRLNSCRVFSKATLFRTNKRIDTLALPRGIGTTVSPPPPPNYGRLLNLSEELAREKNESRRRSFSALRPGLSNPVTPKTTPLMRGRDFGTKRYEQQRGIPFEQRSLRLFHL